MRSITAISTLTLAYSLTGCFAPKPSGDDSGGVSAGGTTIYDIQQGNVEEGETLTLSGVEGLGKTVFDRHRYIR